MFLLRPAILHLPGLEIEIQGQWSRRHAGEVQELGRSRRRRDRGAGVSAVVAPADKEAAAYDFDADRRPALISSGPPTSSSVAGGRRDEASRPRRGSGWWNLPRR